MEKCIRSSYRYIKKTIQSVCGDVATSGRRSRGSRSLIGGSLGISSCVVTSCGVRDVVARACGVAQGFAVPSTVVGCVPRGAPSDDVAAEKHRLCTGGDPVILKWGGEEKSEIGNRTQIGNWPFCSPKNTFPAAP